MEQLEVTRVLDDNAKHGVSQKTNKPWSMSRVELSNGESVFIFNPIAQGDKVQGVQNGEYINYQKVKPDPRHDEVMKGMRALYKKLSEVNTNVQKLLYGEGGPVDEPEPKTQPAASPVPTQGTDTKRDWGSVGQAKQDTIHPVDEDDDIKLEDIPF